MRHDIVQERAEVFAFIIILPCALLSMLGNLALASDNMTWINIALGERGSLFLLDQVKCVNIFFPKIFSMIVASTKTNRL